MRLISLLLLFMLVCPLFAQEQADAEAGPQFDERILEDPKFKTYVDECEKLDEQAKASDPNADTMGTCINTAFTNKIDDTLRQELIDKYITQKIDKKDKQAKKLANYQQLTPKTFEKKLPKTPEFLALVKHLTDRLNEAMYGKDPKSKKIANHGAYYELYKNQLSKNVVLTLSSFCLEAEKKSSSFLIYSDETKRKTTRESNLKDLGNVVNSVSSAANTWLRCIAKVSDLCTGSLSHISDTDDKDYTKKRACLVTNSLKQQKLALKTTNEIQNALKKQLRKKSISASNIKYDDMTSLTSGELDKTYNKKSEEVQTELENCRQSPDDPKCKELIEAYTGNQSDLEKGKVEFSLLSKQRNEKLKADLSNQDAEKVKEVILTEANIDKKDEEFSAQKDLLDDQEVQDIRDRINKTYANEAQAIQAELQKKIDLAKKNSEDKIDSIQKNLKASAETKKALMHYNNIVSGYLTPGEVDASGQGGNASPNKQNNYKSIQRELADSAYEEKDSGPSPASAGNTNTEYQKRVEQIKAETDLSLINDEQSNSFIQVEDINKKILKIQKNAD